jgi:hypothetical protein
MFCTACGQAFDLPGLFRGYRDVIAAGADPFIDRPEEWLKVNGWLTRPAT